MNFVEAASFLRVSHSPPRCYAYRFAPQAPLNLMPIITSNVKSTRLVAFRVRPGDSRRTWVNTIALKPRLPSTPPKRPILDWPTNSARRPVVDYCTKVFSHRIETLNEKQNSIRWTIVTFSYRRRCRAFFVVNSFRHARST